MNILKKRTERFTDRTEKDFFLDIPTGTVNICKYKGLERI